MTLQRTPTWLVLLVLFASMVSAVPSTAQSAPVTLDVVASSPSAGGWYDVDHPLVLDVAFVNTGDATESIPNDPSCDVVLRVHNASGVTVFDGTSACLDRARGFDLFPGETRSMDPLTWSMQDSDGEWLPSGRYRVEAHHSSTGLSRFVDAEVHTPVTVPAGLELRMTVHPTSTADMPSLVVMSMTNPTSTEVSVGGLPPCVLELEINGILGPGPSCFAGVATMMPGEVLYLGHQAVWGAEAVRFDIGVQGKERSISATVAPQLNVVPPHADLSVTGVQGVDQPYAAGEVFSPQLVLTSTFNEEQTLRFTQSCKSTYWVFDDSGALVHDAGQNTACNSINLESTLDATSSEIFSMTQWDFRDSDGCSLPSGRLLVVAALPELGLMASTSMHHDNAGYDVCASVDAMRLVPSIQTVNESTYLVGIELTNSGQDVTLRMVEACSLVLTFTDGDGEVQHRYDTMCNDYGGRLLVLSANSTLTFPPVTFSTKQGGLTLLNPGQYTMEATLVTSGRIDAAVDFLHVGPASIEASTAEETTVAATFTVAGQWSGLLTEQGTCWVLEEGGTMYLLSTAIGAGQWTPSPTVQGIYTVRSTEPAPACASYAAMSLNVDEVVMETPLAANADESVEQSNGVMQDVPTASVAVEPVAVVGAVVTVSLLSMLGVVVASNEGLRIPSTLAGLWFLGLIGKTHETTDGRYQRGRLMGYLTANPGCHFRALMSALEMSNGQISHHLRILENEENVWRKKDGRLVRYYPLTSQLHPNMRDEDLPVPPLSPDPNSLQGKILTLLDHDGGLGEFPTQAELAKRLEKSQQLVSHHLRTLEKYGLVERRKMGVKQRYKLTREAVFLLETSDDFR
jgi:predicted transcriptional regulator